MAKDKVVLEEKVALAEDISVEVNAKPLHHHTGRARVIAWACEPCGLFLGYTHDVKDRPTCAGPGKDDPLAHDPRPADQYDADTVRAKKRESDGKLFQVQGRKIEAPRSSEAIKADMAKLQAELDVVETKAAEDAASKKG